MATMDLSPEELKVDLKAFSTAMDVVRTQGGIINDQCDRIAAVMRALPGTWVSPSGDLFQPLYPKLTKQMNNLRHLLSDMLQRMQDAYDNYVNVEQTNFNNLGGKTVGGKTLWGTHGSDGSFLSKDGTTYVTPQGQVQHGITDPATGVFLQHGEVRTIDGAQVYGSVQKDGTFYSEDGKILVTPTGFVEHGKTLPDRTFLAKYVLPNGETLWGSYGSDGSFLPKTAPPT